MSVGRRGGRGWGRLDWCYIMPAKQVTSPCQMVQGYVHVKTVCLCVCMCAYMQVCSA